MDVLDRFKAQLRSVEVGKIEKQNDSKNYDIYTFTLLVPSSSELDKIISQFQKVKGVEKVKRI